MKSYAFTEERHWIINEDRPDPSLAGDITQEDKLGGCLRKVGDYVFQFYCVLVQKCRNSERSIVQNHRSSATKTVTSLYTSYYKSRAILMGLVFWLVMYIAPVNAQNPSVDSLVTIEGYGKGPMEFAIGEHAAITLRYREDLDVERVQVKLNGESISEMLNPIPGEEETVPIYLEDGKNRLVISASSIDYQLGGDPEEQFEYWFLRTLKPEYRNKPSNAGFF